MKVIAVNGSPRESWNTAQLCQEALKGASSLGAETELFHLYAQEFKGCVSCFACKIKGNKANGLCAYRDALTPLLQKVREADALIIGSPVYYDYPTAQTRAFLERLMFPVDPYMVDPATGKQVRYLDKIVPTAMIYTMNCPEWLMEKVNYPAVLGVNEAALSRLFGFCETLYSCDTYQYTDYAKYDCNMFDAGKKAEQREKQFPIDLQNAFELGKRLVEKAKEEHE